MFVLQYVLSIVFNIVVLNFIDFILEDRDVDKGQTWNNSNSS